MIIVFKDLFPVGFSHAVSLAKAISLINKLRPVIKTKVIASNNNALIKSKYHLLDPIDLKSHITHSFVEEYHFIYFVELIKDERPRHLLPWLKMS